MKAKNPDAYPMRINKYLALKNYSTRRGADELVAKKQVSINGRIAVLGDKVSESDDVEVRGSKKPLKLVYYAYNKPAGVNCEPTLKGEKDIMNSVALKGVFPVGFLDKNSHGLVILTNDRRIVDRLTNPKYKHEKEYVVKATDKLRTNFKEKIEEGVDTGHGHEVNRCKIMFLPDYTFKIIMTDNKNPIRQICSLLFTELRDVQRIRIMNVRIGYLASNSYRELEGDELHMFLEGLGL